MLYDKKILIDTENLKFEIDGVDISRTEDLCIYIKGGRREIGVTYWPETKATAKAVEDGHD